MGGWVGAWVRGWVGGGVLAWERRWGGAKQDSAWPSQRQRCSHARTLPSRPRAQVTIEEREEYEQHIRMGTVVYAGECLGGRAAAPAGEACSSMWGTLWPGPLHRCPCSAHPMSAQPPPPLPPRAPGVDYEAILRRAEREADVVVWDGARGGGQGGGRAGFWLHLQRGRTSPAIG